MEEYNLKKFDGWIIHPSCEKHQERTQQLEQQVAVLTDRMGDLRDIKDSIKSIERYIAQSSTSIPRMEQALLLTNKQITIEHRQTDERLSRVEVNIASERSRAKVVFGILSTIGVVVLGIGLKLIFL